MRACSHKSFVPNLLVGWACIPGFPRICASIPCVCNCLCTCRCFCKQYTHACGASRVPYQLCPEGPNPTCGDEMTSQGSNWVGFGQVPDSLPRPRNSAFQPIACKCPAGRACMHPSSCWAPWRSTLPVIFDLFASIGTCKVVLVVECCLSCDCIRSNKALVCMHMLLVRRVPKLLVSVSLRRLSMHSWVPWFSVVCMGLSQPVQNRMILAVERSFHEPLRARPV